MKSSRRFPHIPIGLLGLFLLCCIVCTGGCNRGAGAKLVGNWEGKPDSEAARKERELSDEAAKLEKAGKKPSKNKKADIPEFESSSNETVDLQAGTEKTDFESVPPFTIRLNFINRRQVEMSYNGQPPITKDWQIVDSSPSRMVLELRDPEQSVSDTTEADSANEVRRFVLRFEGEENDRFTAIEDGADPSLGMLLFRKVE